LVGLFVLILVATPFVFAAWLVSRVFDHRLKIAQIRSQTRLALPAAQVPTEVESRLRNLEDIVCGLDFDLQDRLREASGPDRAA
jgi:hypothetical protein